VSKNEVLLRLSGVTKSFRKNGKEVRVVKGIDLDVYKGEVFGLVGESGCGKTTLGRTVIKIYTPTSGDVIFDGRQIAFGRAALYEEYKVKEHATRAEISEFKKQIKVYPERKENASGRIKELRSELARQKRELREEIEKRGYAIKEADREYSGFLVKEARERYRKKREELSGASLIEKIKLSLDYDRELRACRRMRASFDIQMIFQDPMASLNPRMTVKEIISEGLIIRGIRDRELIDREVGRIIELVGLLPEQLDRYPHEFSGGQRQRIGIARAIITKPKLIIADEPLSALDVSIQAQVINLLNDLKRELGLTVLFIAHDLSVVKYFSDRIGVMYKGRIVELGSAEEIFANPLHPYTRALLSNIPLADPRGERLRERKIYEGEAEHDYSIDKPSLREIYDGHFVYANSAEEEKYKRTVKENGKN